MLNSNKGIGNREEFVLEKIITIDNLRNFAYCNNKICKKPIKGIVVSFFGLGETSMFAEETAEGVRFAENGILHVVPYQNPWAWQNKQNVSYTDEIIDVLFNEYDLSDDLPIVSVGGSMGGLSALVYMVYAKRTPVACVANCPVCDLPFHYTERPDLPRTLYSAFYNYDCSLQEALKSASPLDLVDKMPTNSRYYIFHCEEDTAVNKQKHSDRFVEAMKEKHNILYHAVPERGHCDLTDDMKVRYYEYIVNNILKR